VQNGYVDDVVIERIKEFQLTFAEFQNTRKPDLLRRIGQEKALTPALTADLKSTADEFKETWK